MLLAGDAAHVHPPQGGQGLNIGVQDAVNLGWKLAQVVNGTSPESLLDTYHAERHPVGARVLHNTMAQVALGTPDDRHQALRETMAELLAMDEPRRQHRRDAVRPRHPLRPRRGPPAARAAHARPRPATPRTARRACSRCCTTPDPCSSTSAEPGAFDIGPWADRVRLVDGTYDGEWELPVLGAVDAPAAVLIRPDGYVAWTGTLTDDALPSALETWFGPPASP